MQVLVNNGADVRAANQAGETPLHNASREDLEILVHDRGHISKFFIRNFKPFDDEVIELQAAPPPVQYCSVHGSSG